MHIQRLILRNFRTYQHASFEFSAGINVIAGPNATGKTSLLEALYLVMTGRSFRTQNPRDLIRIGDKAYYAEVDFVKNGIEQKIRIGFDGTDRHLYYNATPLRSAASLIGLLQGVVMTPDDIALVKGAPGKRRQFLDMQLAQVNPLYVHYLTRYTRAMQQRNVLLKSKSVAAIETWEHEMAHAAAYLKAERETTVKELQNLVSGIHGSISSDQGKLSVAYCPAFMNKEQYLRQLERDRGRELRFGFTLNGPHKDDLAIALGEQEARFFGSEGQQRGCAAILRLAEWHCMAARTEGKPIMLLDDIGISLDAERKKRLLGVLPQLGQVFVTTTSVEDADHLPHVHVIEMVS